MSSIINDEAQSRHYFWAKNCGHCKQFEKVHFHNIRKNHNITSKYGDYQVIL